MAEAVASVCQELSQNGMIYTLAWTNGKELCTEEIPGTDELLQIIPQMYKSGTDLETIEEFTDGQVCALICDGAQADSQIYTVTYGAETVREDLQMVVL